MPTVGTLIIKVFAGTSSTATPTASLPRYKKLFTDDDLERVFSSVERLGHTTRWYAGTSQSTREIHIIIPKHPNPLAPILAPIVEAVDSAIK